MKTRTWVLILLLVVTGMMTMGGCDDDDTAPTVARTDDSTVTPVPAPASVLLVAGGCALVGWARRKEWF